MCDYLLGITREVAFSFDSDLCVNFGDVNVEALTKHLSSRPPPPLIGGLLVLNSQVEKVSKSLITWLSLVVFSWIFFFILVIFALCFTGRIFWID
jgi:hypothetical protein